MTEIEGHALAGLIDAEGTFAIVANNQGRNWRCSMCVCLRRDDVPVLSVFQQLTGIGTITAVPARAMSNPQASWTVSSSLECLHLAELLERFPLRGRKRRDARVWTEAVRAFASGDTSQGPRLARLIRKQRAYAEPDCIPCPPTDEPGLLWYFGGFFTGEGFFQLSRRTARVGIKLRRDDRPLLDAFAKHTGLGKVYDIRATAPAKPASQWLILNQGEFPETLELLSAARLRGRKRREFHVWRVGAEEFSRARTEDTLRNGELLDAAAKGLRRARTYRDIAMPLQPSPEAEARRAFIGVLQEFSRAPQDALTCTKYTRLRAAGRAHWPTSTTLSLTFGS